MKSIAFRTIAIATLLFGGLFVVAQDTGSQSAVAPTAGAVR